MEGNFEENADKNKRKNWNEDSTLFKKKKPPRKMNQARRVLLRVLWIVWGCKPESVSVDSTFMENILQTSYKILEDLVKKCLLLSTIWS